MVKEWFDTWFDSKYYHILYNNRNDAEAQLFIDNMVKYLSLSANQKVLDLACGKGRHSVMLLKHGLQVVGADLSKNSIQFAKQMEQENLEFYVHDMRNIIRTNYFDAVFNCFTSFGYFKNRHHNQLAANAMLSATVPNGKIVIDFLNSAKAKDAIEQQSFFDLLREGISFKIHKKIENGFFMKNIEIIEDNKEPQYFSETVQAFYLNDFIEIFSKAGAVLEQTFGDYHLNKFDEKTSPRLIMVFKKNN
jgi:cyclopropane fatty-acyl-phospholipid synthase-like methyltransferase